MIDLIEGKNKMKILNNSKYLILYHLLKISQFTIISTKFQKQPKKVVIFSKG